MYKSYLAAICLSTTLLLTAPAAPAQNGAPQVSMVTLQVVQNSDGSQSVITPKGDLAPLPGAGVNTRTADIFMGAQGGFWYFDKNGQNVNLDAAVQALQARRASNKQTVQVPQYAPQPYYQAAPQQQSTGGGGASALGTAAAAGMGAMAGAAMSNSYYNTPYGTPMYYGANGHPYTYGNGEQRELEELNPNQKAVMYNKRQNEQQSQQQALEQGQAYRQNQQSQQSQQSQPYAHQQNFQHQQQWYQNEMKQNPNQFQKVENNPFVSQSSSSFSGGNREQSDMNNDRGNRQQSGMSNERGGRERNASGRERGVGGRERGGGGRERGGGGRRR